MNLLVVIMYVTEGILVKKRGEQKKRGEVTCADYARNSPPAFSLSSIFLSHVFRQIYCTHAPLEDPSWSKGVTFIF
eukprot:SAG31_NODE_712_length_12660_cov_9.298463_3_plen_76_part_00